MAGCSVHGAFGLSWLKMVAMSAFDNWIQKFHAELLMEFRSLPKARKTQTFWDWVRENHPGVILKEWPAAAKIRARHLLPEPEHE
jgi:hypothetical protein